MNIELKKQIESLPDLPGVYQYYNIQNEIIYVGKAMLATNEASELIDLQKELDELTEQQETLMLEWEELSEKVEG